MTSEKHRNNTFTFLWVTLGTVIVQYLGYFLIWASAGKFGGYGAAYCISRGILCWNYYLYAQRLRISLTSSLLLAASTLVPFLWVFGLLYLMWETRTRGYRPDDVPGRNTGATRRTVEQDTASIESASGTTGSWQSYRDDESGLSLRHPTAWLVVPKPGVVDFDLPSPDNAYVTIALRPLSDLAGAPGKPEALEAMIHRMVTLSSTETVTVLSKGTWQQPSPTNYVRISIATSGYEQARFRLRIEAPIGARDFLLVDAGKIGPLSDAEIDTIRAVISTTRLTPQQSGLRQKAIGSRPPRSGAGQMTDRASGSLLAVDYESEDPKYLRTLPYHEYLKTAHWRHMRKKALAAAQYHCQLCGRADNLLDVHHNNYARRGQEELHDLVVLCRLCHDRFHATRRVV